MIEVTNLSKQYDKANKIALDKASFTINDGEMVGLIGENGAGKSTLMKTMCKFLGPTSGQVKIFGTDIFTVDNALNEVGILLEPVFYSQLSAYENIKYYLNVHNKSEYIKDINDHLDMVGLSKHKNENPKEFSFGMRQRLGLAMALVGRPKILILDEPFVGLDPNGIDDLIKILKKRMSDDNMSALISSHQLYELSSLCERTIVIKQGRIVFDGVASLAKTITFELDRIIVDDLEGEVIENTISTEKTGQELDDLIGEIREKYQIINVTSNKCALERFFKEGK